MLQQDKNNKMLKRKRDFYFKIAFVKAFKKTVSLNQ